MPDLFITCGLLVSQNMFAYTYGGADDDIAYSVNSTSDGGLVVAGITGSFGTGGYDFLVLKLASDGTLQWSKVLGGSSYDGAYSIIETSDGGLAVAGQTMSFGAGYRDFMILKMSSDGALQWAKVFGGTDYDYPYCITETSDGGFALVGRTMSFGAGSYDLLLLKLASDGTLQWAKTFGGTDWDEAWSITGTSDGGLAVAGYTHSFGAGYRDFLILKLASDGTLQWAKTLGGTLHDDAWSITETSDGGLAVAGITGSFGAGGYDFLVLKMSSDGTLQWAKTFGGTDDDGAQSITETSDGGLAVAGKTKSFGSGIEDFLVLKLSADGSLQWAKVFGGTDYDYPYCITQTSDGGFAVAGQTQSFGASSYDLLLLKLGSDGEYPGCVDACTPTETEPSLIENSLSENVADCTPTISNPTVQTSNPTVPMDTICSYVNISEPRMPGRVPGIRYSPAPGGALFSAAKAADLRLYSVDGRLVRSLRLEQGQNRITLDKGVYLWQAGAYKGKAVVR